MVAVAALAIVRVAGVLRRRTRPGRDDLAWAVPAIAFVAWQVVVKAATGSVPLLADGDRTRARPSSPRFRRSGTTSATLTCVGSTNATYGSSRWPSWSSS